MKALVYGNGAREHALAWKLSKSERMEEVFSVSPNPLMQEVTIAVNLNSQDELVDFCKKEKMDFVVIGPEKPLADGIVDVLEDHGIRAFGPRKKFSWLESSKILSKAFNERNGIPCAEALKVETLEDMKKAIKYFKPPYVLKADGLAAGKGVLTIDDAEEALEKAQEMLNGKFGQASKKLLIEEYLKGKELSVICLYDGKTLLPLEFVRDHKKLLDGDKGPNTGGMGAYSPVGMGDETRNSIFTLLKKVENALKAEDVRYHGVLYVGMILTGEGPKILEYNVRFGDPEAQALMVRLESDLQALISNTLDEKLEKIKISWSSYSNVLTIASEGYPFNPKKDVEIGDFHALASSLNVQVFGGAVVKRDGRYFSSGGRVLSVAAVGDDAHERTLEFANRLEFPSKIYRKDVV